MAKKQDTALNTAAVAASKPQAVAQPPVAKVPVRAMRKFKCTGLRSLNVNGVEYVAKDGYIELLRDDDALYTPMISAGVLKEEL